jgi:putative flippase GtrA
MLRFLRFNGVGLLGFAVQLAVLGALIHLRLHYLAATAVAVEVAVLHNFAWHERWTWRDRAAVPGSGARRLWRFHASNGVISLAGNLVLMRLLVGVLNLPPIAGNLLAVVLCSLLNFAASDRFVFRVT